MPRIADRQLAPLDVALQQHPVVVAEGGHQRLGDVLAAATTLTPSEEPWPAGFTTSGKPRRSSISSSVSAAPSSRKAVALKATQSGVGIPAARRACLAATLSMQSAQAATPGPV